MRHLGHDPEMALSKTNAKFVRSIQGVEDKAREKIKPLHAYTLAELDGFWDEVKLEEN